MEAARPRADGGAPAESSSAPQRRKRARRPPDEERSTVGDFPPAQVARHAAALLPGGPVPPAAAEARPHAGEDPRPHAGEDPRASAAYLVAFLDAAPPRAAADGADITPEDAAGLLLPWSVARLVRAATASPSSAGTASGAMAGADVATAWRALSSCLERLSPLAEGTAEGASLGKAAPVDTSREALLSAALSQSALNRLVPLAANAAFARTSEDPTAAAAPVGTVQRHAANSFVHLARRFRPTLDGACQSLLREVDVLVSSVGHRPPAAAARDAALPPHHADVVGATLTALHALLSGANPKRSFLVLCSAEVLPRLGRLAAARRASAPGNDRSAAGTPSAEELARRLLWDGLLDPVHHVEGFRTMAELHVPPAPPSSAGDGGRAAASADPPRGPPRSNGGGPKACFRAALFASLRSLLSPVAAAAGGDEEGGEPTAARDAAAVAGLLPVVVQGFFERMRSRATRSVGGGGRGSAAPEAEAKLQFRFWSAAMLPAFKTLFRTDARLPGDRGQQAGLRLALLKATSRTLGLVLEYDVYLPSYSDPDGQHLAFLEGVTTGLLGCLGNGLTEEATAPTTKCYVHELGTALRHILLLNYRLLHEQLAAVVPFACSCLPDLPCDGLRQQKTSPAEELLPSIVKTYRELRQVGHFLAATRKAFAAGGNSPRVSLACMQQIHVRRNSRDALAVAYQSCPSGQLREIWDFFDDWIASLAGRHDASASDAGAAAVELSFAVRMFVLFVQNVRADKQNAPELRRLCDKSARTSVAALLGTTDGDGAPGALAADAAGSRAPLVRRGLELCGWLVDVRTRSAFWSEGGDIAGRVSSVPPVPKDGAAGTLDALPYLRSAAEAAASSARFKAWKASWLQLYWGSSKGSDGFETLSKIDIPPPLRGPLQRLALHRIQQLHSMIYYCKLEENHRGDASPRSSQALDDEARMLVDLSLYIGCSQITKQPCTATFVESSESLWSPLAQSLGTWIQYANIFHAEVFLIWFFSVLCQSRFRGLSAGLVRVEKAIVLTLSRDASFYDVSKLMSSFMKVGIQFAFSQLLNSIETNCKPPKVQESSGFTLSCIEMTKQENVRLADNNFIEAVSTSLSFLASAPLELALSNENLSLLDRIVGLDIVASQVINASRQEGTDRSDPQLLNIVRSAKMIIANILPKIACPLSDLDVPCLANVTSHLSKCCSDFRFDKGILSSLGSVISEYFSLCVDYHEKDDKMLAVFLTQMDTVVQNAASSDFIPNAYLVRSVIRRMNIMDRHKKTETSTVYHSFMNFVQETQKHLQNKIFQHIANSGSGDDELAPIALLIASDIYSFLGNHLVTMPEESLMIKEQVQEYGKSVRHVMELVTCEQGCQHGPSFSEALNYFLASISTASRHVSTYAVSDKIVEVLAQSVDMQKESPLLDAAISSIIRNSNLEQTKHITTFVEIHGIKKHNPSFMVKMFHLLMKCSKTPEQHKYISGKCKKFLSISMCLLRERSHDRIVNNSKTALGAITTLISKKELLLLSGREIAVICCEMSPLLHYNGATENNSIEDITIFNSCCSVISSLIAQYPKQLYGCPSPLFSVLLALLTHLLDTNHEMGLSQKALGYAKVCELLIAHKDIFKKHVVGLLLRYIQALNKGMNPVMKSKLMPSIFALLDMCSEFETRHINAMIDVPSKTLFAPIFKSYQKTYQYHGQA